MICRLQSSKNIKITGKLILDASPIGFTQVRFCNLLNTCIYKATLLAPETLAQACYFVFSTICQSELRVQ